jgi:hypothetical protein
VENVNIHKLILVGEKVRVLWLRADGMGRQVADNRHYRIHCCFLEVLSNFQESTHIVPRSLTALRELPLIFVELANVYRDNTHTAPLTK